MTFAIGTLVKWTDSSPTRLGYAPSAIGKVVGVKDCPKDCEIDVEFDDGVVRGAIERWFEPAPRAKDADAEEERRLVLVD
jgi:hypothetical protein